MKEKILVIAGDNHCAGCEMNGVEDSKENRSKSFGGLLAKKLGYKPVNIAYPGSSNTGIARSVMEWVHRKYDSYLMDVTFLVGWTESSRIDVPYRMPKPYDTLYPGFDWVPLTQQDYLMINTGYPGSQPDEKLIIADWQPFMHSQNFYFEILTFQYILQLQYLFKSHNFKYIMCNTLNMYSENNAQAEFYKNCIDTTYYYEPWENMQSFYFKYAHQGHKNEKAKYMHHGEEPHRLYAEEL